MESNTYIQDRSNQSFDELVGDNLDFEVVHKPVIQLQDINQSSTSYQESDDEEGYSIINNDENSVKEFHQNH